MFVQHGIIPTVLHAIEVVSKEGTDDTLKPTVSRLLCLCVQVLDNMVSASPEYCKIVINDKGDEILQNLMSAYQADADIVGICKFALSSIAVGTLDAQEQLLLKLEMKGESQDANKVNRMMGMYAIIDVSCNMSGRSMFVVKSPRGRSQPLGGRDSPL